MADTVAITIAGQGFTVRRLTLRQLRDLQVGSAKAFNAPDELADRVLFSYEADLGIIAAALARDYPAMTVDALYDLETTKTEIGDAAMAILRFSGLVSGESEAPATAESSGAISTVG